MLENQKQHKYLLLMVKLWNAHTENYVIIEIIYLKHL